MNIFVGNLPYTASEEEVKQEFSAFGQVKSVTLIKDRETGQARGFGFVEMPNEAEAMAAIEGLNGKPFRGRALIVNAARPRESRDGGGRGGQGGGERRSYSGERSYQDRNTDRRHSY